MGTNTTQENPAPHLANANVWIHEEGVRRDGKTMLIPVRSHTPDVWRRIGVKNKVVSYARNHGILEPALGAYAGQGQKRVEDADEDTWECVFEVSDR